jgi:hypothetical protein
MEKMTWYRNLLICLICCQAAPLWAQDYVGTRARSLGGAYRAIATGNDAIYFNPAGLPQLPRYSPEVHYLSDFSLGQQEVNISVVDSKSPLIAAGVGYAFAGWDLQNEAISRSHTATLGLGLPVVPGIVNVGAGLKYVNLLDALGAGDVLNILSADLGVLAMIPGGVQLAAVGYNLVPVKTDSMPLSVGLGFAWNLGPFSSLFTGQGTTVGSYLKPGGIVQPLSPMSGPLRDLTLSTDYHYRLDNTEQGLLSVGAEYLLMAFAPLRVGYENDWQTRKQHLSAGVGFIFPTFAMDIAFRQNLDWKSERQLSFAFKFFLNP